MSPTKNSLLCKTVFQKWERNIIYFRQTKTGRFGTGKLDLKEMFKDILSREKLWPETKIYIKEKVFKKE